MSVSTGTRFGQYEVTAPLGKGGMGEVCLAEDTRLQRKVALKLLPAEFTQDSERLRRFALEAKTASGLNHPNIITIYDIGAAHDTHYIATEFIAGQTLRTHLRHPLPIGEALDIALQIAAALAAAHEAGIMHRDIKPENVMLRTDGIVKVLDFGLAKLTGLRIADRGLRNEEDAATLAQSPADNPQSPIRIPQSTLPGTVMGTASYMSPEQARGQRVDARTDIFSLGVVLYEMLAGQRPFAGVNMIDVLGAILHETPAPLVDVPMELQRIVTRTLQKDRAARYQSAQELAHDLQELKDELTYQARAARTQTERRGTEGLGAEGLGAQASCLPLASASDANSVVRESAQDEATSSQGARAALHALAAGKMPALPGAPRTSKYKILLAVAALVLIAVAAFFYFKRSPALTDKDTILLADFTNTTGDAVFDGTLKQALAVHLGQSPFLNLFADERVRETLRLMNKSPDERITPTTGREICQRQGLKAMLTGTIASLGRNYVISLEAVNGQTGDVLAREQGEAEGKEQVLRTLGTVATRLREKLGESLSSMQRFNAPIEQATTSSLEALKAFEVGAGKFKRGEYTEAIPFFKRAVEIDPKFAMAFMWMAYSYNNLGQEKLSFEYVEKAVNLRERATEIEKMTIAAEYEGMLTGDQEKYIELLQLMRQTYPNDYISAVNLALTFKYLGQFEKAVTQADEAIRLNPDLSVLRSGQASSYIGLNRFDEAQEVCEQAVSRNLDDSGCYENLFLTAVIRGDMAAMKRQLDLMRSKLGEHEAFKWQARTAAFNGQLRQAVDFAKHAAVLTEQRNLPEGAGEMVSSSAEWVAVLGHCPQSRDEIARTTALPRTPLSYFCAGIALALCSATAQAQSLADEAVKRYPKHTLVNEAYLPLIRAALELQRGNRKQAIQILEPARRYESVSFFYQNYLRGQAYLGERNGAAAASEFQKILNHRGWSPTSPLYPLAHLGLARAAMLQGDAAKAQKSYQDFFALWKDADADLPVLVEAKKEYEKLK